MKFITIAILLALTAFVPTNAQEKKTLKIVGYVKGLKDGSKIFLKANIKNRLQTDTIAQAIAKEGKFELSMLNDFDGISPFCWVRIENIEETAQVLFDLESTVTIKSDVNIWPKITIEGSDENLARQEFMEMIIDPKAERISVLNAKYKSMLAIDSLKADQILKEANLVVQSQLEDYWEFIINHPNSLFSAFCLYKIPQFDSAKRRAGYGHLTREIRESFVGRRLKEVIEVANKSEQVFIGNLVPNFTSTTPEGKIVSFYDLLKKGKYTLVDFWASWCAPCRAETPNIKKLYEKYHLYGFNIIGVSMDYKSAPWKEAIQRDGMYWDHISNLEGRGGEIEKIFNLDGIPAYIMVDQEGKLIEVDVPHLKDVSTQGANLRAEKLQRKLDELFSTEKSFVETRDKRNEFNQMRIDLLRQLKSLGNNIEATKVLQNKLAEHDEMVSSYWDKYINEHPNAPYSLHLLASKADKLSLDDLRKQYESLNATVKNGDNDIYIKRRITERSERLNRDTERAKVIAIGKNAPDFTATDIAGRPLSLKDILKRGELTFVDFWASWCAPCRAETPMVAKTYSEFKSKGLNVISYSVDRDLTAWKKAVKEDNMVWYNVSEPNGGMNQAYDLFYVENTVPATYLLDKEGKILAINLTGEQLYKRVSELLALKSEHERK